MDKVIGSLICESFSSKILTVSITGNPCLAQDGQEIMFTPLCLKFNDFKKNGFIKIIFEKLMIRGGKYIIDIHSSIRAGKRIKLDNIMNAAILNIKPGNYYKAVSIESTESIMLLDCKITN